MTAVLSLLAGFSILSSPFIGAAIVSEIDDDHEYCTYQARMADIDMSAVQRLQADPDLLPLLHQIHSLTKSLREGKESLGIDFLLDAIPGRDALLNSWDVAWAGLETIEGGTAALLTSNQVLEDYDALLVEWDAYAANHTQENLATFQANASHVRNQTLAIDAAIAQTIQGLQAVLDEIDITSKISKAAAKALNLDLLESISLSAILESLLNPLIQAIAPDVTHAAQGMQKMTTPLTGWDRLKPGLALCALEN